MRKIIFVICGIQIAIVMFILISAFTMSSDAAGEGMAQGLAIIGALVVSIFIVPALLLAVADKALKVALVLSLTAPALLFIATSI
ncbi:hypothetical protein N9K16_02215 [Alphaproteobacteria bacterium]|jgi:hypothetical protein|nr:hypothetical protein [Alphaproteobacteria bacterium]